MYSLLENNYFQVQLTGIVKLYSGDVLPRLNKKNTVILIGSAVALSFAYIIRDNLFKPPKNLRHIPYFGYFSVIKSVVVGQSLFDRGYRTHVPFADSRRDGLYLVLDYTFKNTTFYKKKLYRNREKVVGKFMYPTLQI